MFLGAMTRTLSEAQKDRLKRVLSVVPPRWRQGGTYWQWRHFLDEAQYWSSTRIETWQLDRLRNIVRHAIDHTEGYRELYRDRKSTRLNSSHGYISYAVFCLKKKK